MAPLFLLAPAPRCGTNFLYDLLLMHEKVIASSVDESYLLDSVPLLNPFIDRIISRSSLPEDLHEDAVERLRKKTIEGVLDGFNPGLLGGHKRGFPANQDTIDSWHFAGQLFSRRFKISDCGARRI